MATVDLNYLGWRRTSKYLRSYGLPVDLIAGVDSRLSRSYPTQADPHLGCPALWIAVWSEEFGQRFGLASSWKTDRRLGAVG
jgi:hypothetical protein